MSYFLFIEVAQRTLLSVTKELIRIIADRIFYQIRHTELDM